MGSKRKRENDPSQSSTLPQFFAKSNSETSNAPPTKKARGNTARIKPKIKAEGSIGRLEDGTTDIIVIDSDDEVSPECIDIASSSDIDVVAPTEPDIKSKAVFFYDECTTVVTNGTHSTVVESDAAAERFEVKTEIRWDEECIIYDEPLKDEESLVMEDDKCLTCPVCGIFQDVLDEKVRLRHSYLDHCIA